MHIKKLKVRRPKARFETPCAAETLAMLNCWAATKDVTNMGACQDSAKGLMDCMRSGKAGKTAKHTTINYHLARLQKVLK